MNEHTEGRALNAFSAMGNLPDNYVLAAENALYEAEAGLYRPEKARGPILRFLNSGVGVALISGIAALAAIALIVRAGQAPGTVTPPVQVNPPVGSTLSDATETGSAEGPVDPDAVEGVNFTLATEQPTYEVGVDRIAVEVTGLRLGETITSPDGWYLERLTADGIYEMQHCFYTEEFVMADAEPDEYASFKKTIFVDRGLESGTYRLHATRHNGEEYESLTWCRFSVGDPETSAEDAPSTDAPVADYDHYAESGTVNFTLSTDSRQYLEGTTSFVVKLTGKNPGEDISLPGEWHLYQVVDGEREPVVGMYYTDEEVYGIAPDENTCATLTKTIFINPHNTSGGLAAGTYVLCACVETESGSEAVECAFEVVSQTAALGTDDTYHGGVDRFYIASGVTYECIGGGIFQCCKDKGSDIFITVDAPCYIGTDTFYDYITSDGKVHHLVDHSRT